MNHSLHVAVAVIQIQDRILIAKRPQHLHKGGYWEFPGGKVENGEPVQTALVRECQEELAITPLRFTPLKTIRHDYPEKSVLLDVWRVNDYLGVPKGLEGQPLFWCPLDKLTEYQFPEANLSILELLSHSRAV
ncbi:8-oxo-dGTP diphosphatase MutT [Kangiella sp. TOML190]|uniref:8-oxo-dGTP diphosphatase MutT n=1 Tax=Kangiella sp. TOML190 TaxID=2931351 RepID=UPI00203B9BDF|nr:8-oxo-dGTP diphosphatase MutT [Kangiella sp. TOML190]